MRQKPKTRREAQTRRILKIHHMFLFFQEVSMQELRNTLPGWSDKTFSRDIALLKLVGVPIVFSERRQAFISGDRFPEEAAASAKPSAPQRALGIKEQQYVDRIRRLTTLMSDMSGDDCDIWYRQAFPELS